MGAGGGEPTRGLTGAERVQCVANCARGVFTAGARDRPIPDEFYNEGAKDRLEEHGDTDTAASFMNWGFAPLHAGAEAALQTCGGANRDQPRAEMLHSATTYLNMLDAVGGAAGLRRGARVLEVGCGRGAGLNLLARSHPRLNFVGLDIAPAQIECAKSMKNAPRNTEWVVGSALDLPFEDGSFDAVINIESSHCYPDFRKFIAEVERVLKPGGIFSITDMRWKKDGLFYYLIGGMPAVQQSLAALRESGLKLLERTDVSRNVLDSRRACTPSEAERIRENEPRRQGGGGYPPLTSAGAYEMNMRGLVGTTMFRFLRRGYFTYFHWRAQKPQD